VHLIQMPNYAGPIQFLFGWIVRSR
jgi:hypothetical protein